MAAVRRCLSLLSIVALMATLVGVAPAHVAAVAGGTFYVDGKNGSDGNSGTSSGSAFRIE